MRIRAVVLALALVLAPVTFAGQTSGAAGRPDIIFIMIDTLRADHLGCYGYPRQTSPAIDEIAAESLVFTDAVAPAPWTMPSMASIFTSLYPGTHRVADHKGQFRKPGDRTVTDVLADSFTTLAEGLTRAGYQTVAFVANPWLHKTFGYGQGFQLYAVRPVWQTPGLLLNAGALQWLEQRDTSKPFFLYLHYIEVHAPYNGPAEFRQAFAEPLDEMARRGALTPLPPQLWNFKGFGKQRLRDVDPLLARYVEYWVARYDAGIRDCDGHIGGLYRGLKQLGVWEKSFVVITSDHGEELVEHGGSGHGENLHAHQLQVPLIIHTPWHSAPARIKASVSLLDIAPTLWDLAGAEIPEQAQGRSLLPMIRDPAARKPSIAFAEGVKRQPSLVSAQYGGRKLVTDIEGGKPRYYDLRTDPLERRPANAPTDEVAASLRAALDVWLQRTRSQAAPAAPQTTIDPETERQLRSLGYLGDD